MDLKWLTPMDEDEFNVFWRTIMPVNEMADSLRSFMKLTERSLRDALDEHVNAPKIPYEEGDQEYIHYYEEMEQEAKIELACTFPALAWSSIFLTIYTLLEHELVSIAKHMGKVKGIAAHPEKNKKSKKGIFAIREFLVDNFQMDPEIDKRWPELEALNKIRNCLAHDRGILGEPVTIPFLPPKNYERDCDIREYAEKNPKLVHVGSDRQIRVGSEFCTQALATVESFLNRVIDEARMWLGRWNELQGIKSERKNRVHYLMPWVPFAADYR